ncbi:hypothetical protein B296_00055881 [Ensete ventricosum]|uniref:Uncharacterized protein n=1 Tax=Ensete ventricosum TaxID=4639 RepID=A0A426XHD1_ENSVE|nr:hypothetical protein B296_00055881 [Ensete ventricosum]
MPAGVHWEPRTPAAPNALLFCRRKWKRKRKKHRGGGGSRKQSERNKSRGVKLWLEARTERQTRGRLRAIGFLIILEVIVHCTPDDLPALGDTGERNGAPCLIQSVVR